MRTFKVVYEADGNEHIVICKAWSKSAARVKAKQMALELGYDSVRILSITLTD